MLKKKKLQRTVFGIISALIIGVISLQSEKIYSFSKGNYGLELTPSEYQLNNMRPGYIEERILTVKNTGDLIMKYTVISDFKSGEKLFNELDVTVKKENKEIYKGKLSKLKIDPGTLPARTAESLTFSIGLPNEVGNGFQGLKTSFEIQIQGEGDDHPVGNPGEDGGNNPPESNNPPKDENQTPSNPPAKDTGSLPQTGEENPISLILLGVFMSITGLGLLLRNLCCQTPLKEAK